MINELNDLKQKICKTNKIPHQDKTEIERIKKNTTVALMAGGESSRFKSVPGSENSNKNSFVLPNGDTMIQMTIRMYKTAGFTNFAALVFHQADNVEKVLGDGSSLGINIKYSYDPKKPIGKAGAILNAVLNGTIPENNYLIVQNPDDIILEYNGIFPDDLISTHIYGEQKGCIGTVAVTEETPYQFSGMSIDDNYVTDIQMYPMIPIPTHIGITMFSPSIYPYFKKLFDLNIKNEFEQILFPILASEKKLYSLSVPNDNWIAVNNLKSYNTLVKRLNLA